MLNHWVPYEIISCLCDKEWHFFAWNYFPYYMAHENFDKMLSKYSSHWIKRARRYGRYNLFTCTCRLIRQAILTIACKNHYVTKLDLSLLKMRARPVYMIDSCFHNYSCRFPERCFVHHWRKKIQQYFEMGAQRLSTIHHGLHSLDAWIPGLP